MAKFLYQNKSLNMKFEPIKLGYSFLLIGVFVFYVKYTDANIKNPNDLYFSTGHLSNYRGVILI